jgi:ABC-2 type transport system ATP-binding protein
MNAAIVAEGLTKRFGERVAVDNLSLEVVRGEVFGFLGPNGAGKTTTIGMLLGLVQPSAGRAVVLGHDVQQQAKQALRGVGAMIETPAFYPYLSGRDNLRVLARAGGLPDNCVDAALAIVDLTLRAKDRFKAYSQGMRQRLGIAAALLSEPELIILDEPTNGLDPAGQQEIRELVLTLAQSGRTIFFSSHMLHEVEHLCARVAILNQGRLIAQGRVADLLRRGRGVLVRVSGDVAQATAALQSLEWVAGVQDHNGALLVDAPIERTAEITMLLASRSIAVAEIRAHEERLEDFFLDITRVNDTMTR